MSSRLSLISCYVIALCFFFSQLGRKICLFSNFHYRNVCREILVQKLHNCFRWNLRVTNATIHLIAEVFLLILEKII